MIAQRIALGLLIVGFLLGLIGVTGPSFSVKQLVIGLIMAIVGVAILVGVSKNR